MAKPGGQRIEQPLGGADSLLQPALNHAGIAAAALQLLGQAGLAEQVGELVQPTDRPQRRGGAAAAPRRSGHGARMDPSTASRPVSSAASRAPSLIPATAETAALRRCWPTEARPLAESLLRQLSIGDRQWHALKGQPRRRAAEQLAAALLQLLALDVDGSTAAPETEQALALIESASAWLRGSQRDPGCPRSQR